MKRALDLKLIVRPFRILLLACCLVGNTTVANAFPQLVGDFSVPECRTAFEMAKAVYSSGDAHFAVPDALPDATSGKMVLSLAHSSNIADTSVFKLIDPTLIRAEGVKRAYWQINPSVDRRIVVVQNIYAGKDLFVTFLPKASMTEADFFKIYPEFLDPASTRRRELNSIGENQRSTSILTNEESNKLWEINQDDDNAWDVESLSPSQQFECRIDFKSWIPAVQLSKQLPSRDYCMENRAPNGAIFCGAGLSEEERRNRIWRLFANKKINTDDCLHDDKCEALAAAFQSRQGIAFENAILRVPSPTDPRLGNLIHGSNTEFGRDEFGDMGAGPVAVFDIPSYHGTGIDAYRVEFYGMRTDVSLNNSPKASLTQIVSPIAGAVEGAETDPELYRVDAGLFRLNGEEFHYEICQNAPGKGYHVIISKRGIDQPIYIGSLSDLGARFKDYQFDLN